MASAAELPVSSPQPSPLKFFEAVNSYQRSAAIKTAVELDVFTAMAEGANTASEIAAKAKADARGIRILCDFLVVIGFVTKQNEHYALTPDSAMFLNRKSQAFVGSAIDFLLNQQSKDAFDHLTEAVRKGGCALEESAIDPEDPRWMDFARSMMPLMFPMAKGTAALLPLPDDRESKVLDIAASHGIYGISIAQRHPKAHIVGLDWKNVLEVTKENAKHFGVADRYSTIPGDAFTIDFGANYDAILLPNILHHFNRADCEKLLTKCKNALRPGGCVAIVEFVPNDDRVSPPTSAGFAMIMLATTPAGDAYTLRDYHHMLSASGLGTPEAYPLPPSEHLLILSKRQ